MLFLILSFLIHLHKLFSMQLGPGTISLACARLIVSFAPFSAIKIMRIVKELVKIWPNKVCDTLSLLPYTWENWMAIIIYAMP